MYIQQEFLNIKIMKTGTVQSQFLKGVFSGIGIVIGYFPIALTFGLLASEQFSPLQAVGFSAFVFAGASQFMAVQLITSGALTAEIVAVTFLMNFRHFLMGTALAYRMKLKRGPMSFIIAFGITDETFTIAATDGHSLSPGFLFGLEITAYSSWVSGTAIGYIAGSFIPEAIQKSMGIVLYALFAALLVGKLKKSVAIALIAGIAAGLNTLLHLFMPIGWSLVIAIIAASILGAAISHTEGEAEE